MSAANPHCYFPGRWNLPRATRDFSLDAVKGALVLVMVLYHAMNIFSTAGAAEYAYIRFVSGSFLFVSGYIIATFYSDRFKSDRRNTCQRLLIRGLKLLILFTALNLLIILGGIGNPGKTQLGLAGYFNHLFDIYVIGRQNYASFQILLPLSYLFFIAPALLALRGQSKSAFIASFGLTFVPNLFDIEWISIGFTALGAMGFFAGVLTNATDRLLDIENPWIALVSLGIAIFCMKYLSGNAGAYALGTLAILKLLHDLCKALDPENSLVKAIILLGRHSLLCYIAQIIFMQLLSIALGRPRWPLGVETGLVVCLTVFFLFFLCKSLEASSERHKYIGRVYRLVFS